ncbi:MAG: ATP-dependent DNA ligase [Casimicrobiaceae bacterium]|nr:ATP-dependent DNA ligase [Casimicrobiaceae bacterium]
MKAFAHLYARLDATTSTEEKTAALEAYFRSAPPEDAAWAAWFLSGGRLGAIVRTRELREVAREAAGLPEWLFEECYQAVGDLAETISLLWPESVSEVPTLPEVGLSVWVRERLAPLRDLPEAQRRARLGQLLAALDEPGRFLLIKLIGGGFRVGVSRLLVERALARVAGVDAKVIAERMMGYTERIDEVGAARYRAIISPAQLPNATHERGAQAASAARGGMPYPFFLAHPLEGDLETIRALLGERSRWQVEWKYDGIRAQLVRREGKVWLWSRGEELVTERFPEVAEAAQALPEGTVLDGELLVGSADAPQPFARLQTRIGRRRLTAKLLAEIPVRFVAYDLLEQDGVDLRSRTLAERRARLEALLTGAPATIECAPVVDPALDWEALAALRATSRARGVEGFMLKALDARYGSGRTKSEGIWWKWKIEPMSVDAVLIYAQAGHGRRASLYTDYTFALWSRAPRDASEVEAVVAAIERGDAPESGGLALVPFAKAYSGLTDEEFRRVDAIIRKHTVNRFGPVRAVKPSLVFEIGFEGIAPSSRHKSGIAVRFPRMLRLREDKPLAEADTLERLRELLRHHAGAKADA